MKNGMILIDISQFVENVHQIAGCTGYFISTVGHISEATKIKYIEEQNNND